MGWNKSFVDICLVLAVHFHTGQNLRTRIFLQVSPLLVDQHMWAEPSQVFKPQELPQQTLYTPKNVDKIAHPFHFHPLMSFSPDPQCILPGIPTDHQPLPSHR